MTPWKTPTELPAIEELLASPVIGLDTETQDPNLLTLGPGFPARDGRLMGFSLGWYRGQEKKGTYIPLFHGGGENFIAPDLALVWLGDVLKRYRGITLGANMLYDLGWLSTKGIKLGSAVLPRDVQWCAALLNEHLTSYSLASLLRLHGLPPKDETLLAAEAKSRGVDPKSGLWQLPGNLVGPYAERDATSLLDIWEQQKTPLDEQNLTRVAKLEHDLLPCLLDMRLQGIRVDINRAHQLKSAFRTKEEAYRLELKQLLGFDVEEWSANSLQKAFDQQGIEYGRTPTGKPSFTADFLAAHPHPLAQNIAKLRKVNKATETFVEKMILKHARGKDGDRIYSEFHPLRGEGGGTVGGRFSSSNPNLQQVPERDPELGPLIRSVFVANQGEEFGSADYSSQEPRLTVHYAILRKVTGWEQLKEQYARDPRTDFHSMVAGWTGLDRKIAKPFNLSLAYGGGLPTIIMQLSRVFGRAVERAEAQDYLNTYHEKMPFVRELSKDCGAVAGSRGYIITNGGRRCRFPYWEPNGYSQVKHPPLPWAQACQKWGEGNVRRAHLHKALNRLIQGSAADQTKQAMLDCWRAGYTPLIQVHDELCFSVGDRAAVPKIKELMEQAVKLEVPTIVDFDIGSSWGEARPFKED